MPFGIGLLAPLLQDPTPVPISFPAQEMVNQMAMTFNSLAGVAAILGGLGLAIGIFKVIPRLAKSIGR